MDWWIRSSLIVDLLIPSIIAIVLGFAMFYIADHTDDSDFPIGGHAWFSRITWAMLLLGLAGLGSWAGIIVRYQGHLVLPYLALAGMIIVFVGIFVALHGLQELVEKIPKQQTR